MYVEGLIGYGAHFAMDNFTFNKCASVPEPSTILFIGVGLNCIGLFGKKPKRK